MRITVDDALAAWRDTVSTFMAEDIGVEYCRERYQNRAYPHALYDAVVENGWIGTAIPEAYGGQGGDQVELAVLLEALGTYGYDFSMPVLTTATVCDLVLEFGTDDQKERFLPNVVAGDRRFSIGVTESETGSDAASIQTRAEPTDAGYVVTGEKIYQSGAHAPGNAIGCYVRTDPDAGREGLSVLLIPNDFEGVEITKLPLVTRKAVGTAQVFFDDVDVPEDHRVGAEGDGWRLLEHHLIREHTHIAAAMVGNAQTVVDTALEHATERERFGRAVADFQVIGHRLADLQTEVDAARLLVYRSASRLDADGGSRRLAAQAKLKAGEVLEEASSAGMQVLGGAGFFPENDMERYWREGKSATVAGATSEIQRSVISAAMRDRA